MPKNTVIESVARALTPGLHRASTAAPIVEKTEAEYHAAALAHLQSHGITNAHAYAHNFHGFDDENADPTLEQRMLQRVKDAEAGAPKLPDRMRCSVGYHGTVAAHAVNASPLPNVTIYPVDGKTGAHIDMSSGHIHDANDLADHQALFAWAAHHLKRLSANKG